MFLSKKISCLQVYIFVRKKVNLAHCAAAREPPASRDFKNFKGFYNKSILKYTLIWLESRQVRLACKFGLAKPDIDGLGFIQIFYIHTRDYCPLNFS